MEVLVNTIVSKNCLIHEGNHQKKQELFKNDYARGNQTSLALSRRRSLSYRNQFLYDKGLRLERVNYEIDFRTSNYSNLVTSKSSCSEVFSKKSALRNFAKFTRENLFQSLFFDKIAATLLKKRLWHRCFPGSFWNF